MGIFEYVKGVLARTRRKRDKVRGGQKMETYVVTTPFMACVDPSECLSYRTY